MTEPMSYREATSEDFAAIMQFLVESFLPNEPTTKALSITGNEEIMQFLKPDVEQCLREPVSFVAVNCINEIVGVRLSYLKNLEHRDNNLCEEDIQNENTVAEDSREISFHASPVDILGNYLKFIEFDFHKLIPKDCTKLFKFNILCVSPDYARRGISSTLLRLSLEKAVHLGCTGVLATATNIITQNMFEKRSFKVLKMVEHKDILDENGRQLIKCSDGTTRGQLMFRNLKKN